MTTSSPQVAVVTGANSGIGRATALHLAQQGYRVFGTVRSLDKASKLQARANELGISVELIEMDVADDASVQRGFADIFRATNRVDVLVNNAGIGGNGVVEESTSQMYHDAFNVNVVGAIRCTQQVLPNMRDRKSGTIVNITSVVGKFAAIAQAPYVASKWAFEGVSEELAQEVAPFGIRVVIIEPGVTKSSIFAKNIDAPNQSGAYDAHYRRMFAFYAAGITNATPAEEVGALIHHAITTDAPQLRYACSWAGPEIVAGRAKQSDSDWVAMAASEHDSDYFDAFKTAYGVGLSNS
jgi:NAD(P)-dependent dehydrogenase (short-subunit alcohol dehydrogenase family)